MPQDPFEKQASTRCPTGDLRKTSLIFTTLLPMMLKGAYALVSAPPFYVTRVTGRARDPRLAHKHTHTHTHHGIKSKPTHQD